MRKLVCRSYNLIASYPVLALLLLAIVTLIYLGQQYRPIEQKEQRELARSMQLRQERQALEQELTNVEMSDLSKRYALFNENFLSEDDEDRSSLIEDISSALKAYGWELQQHSFEPLEEPESLADTDNSEAIQIRANLLQLVATADNPETPPEEPFLPLYSLSEAKKYLWSRSPNKEYQRIKIARSETGFTMEATLFLPIVDPNFSKQTVSE